MQLLIQRKRISLIFLVTARMVEPLLQGSGQGLPPVLDKMGFLDMDYKSIMIVDSLNTTVVFLS
jgi:hypothetical protein